MPTTDWTSQATNDACGKARLRCIKTEAPLWTKPFHCAYVAHEIIFLGIQNKYPVSGCAGTGYHGMVEVACSVMAYEGKGDQDAYGDYDPTNKK